METRQVTQQEALDFCTRLEDHFFDRKDLRISGASLQEHAVAFANADGGELVIGISDEKSEPEPNLRWAGALNPEAFNAHLQNLTLITPGLRLRTEFLSCVNFSGLVLRIFLEKGLDVHQTTAGEVFVRFGAQKLKLKDPQKVMELKFAKGASKYEEQNLPALNTEIIEHGKELQIFLAGYSPSTDSLDFIVKQNLVDANNWTPKVSGALLFADEPQAVMPTKCGIKIIRYETREEEPERDHLASSKTVEGPLYPLIKSAVDTIKEEMSKVSVWTTEGLRTLSYPPEAIWEVLVNAVIHRDYSISDDVQVLIYNDRIVVKSPGRLPGSVTVKNILDSRFARNSQIVRILNKYPDPPNHDLGEGLNTTFQKMKEFRLQPPVIEEKGNYVEITLPHAPLAQPTEVILRFLAVNSEITNRQARELTGIRSENLVKIEFYKLRQAGYLEMIPDKKGASAAWRATTAGSHAIANLMTPKDENG